MVETDGQVCICNRCRQVLSLSSSYRYIKLIVGYLGNTERWQISTFQNLWPKHWGQWERGPQRGARLAPAPWVAQGGCWGRFLPEQSVNEGMGYRLRRNLPSALLRQLDLNIDKENWRLTRYFLTQFPPAPKVFECIPSGSPFHAQYLTGTPFGKHWDGWKDWVGRWKVRSMTESLNRVAAGKQMNTTFRKWSQSL